MGFLREGAEEKASEVPLRSLMHVLLCFDFCLKTPKNPQSQSTSIFEAPVLLFGHLRAFPPLMIPPGVGILSTSRWQFAWWMMQGRQEGLTSGSRRNQCAQKTRRGQKGILRHVVMLPVFLFWIVVSNIFLCPM